MSEIRPPAPTLAKVIAKKDISPTKESGGKEPVATRQKETQRTASVALHKGASATVEKAGKGEELAEGEKKLLSLYQLSQNPPQVETGKPLKGNPLIVTIPQANGPARQGVVTKFLDADGETFTCTVEYKTPDGNIEEDPSVVISTVDIVSAQLVSDADTILSSLGENERVVVSEYIKMLKGKSSESLDPETDAGKAYSATLEKAAKSAGQLTVDDIKAHVDSVCGPEQKTADGHELTEQQVSINQRREKLLGKLGNIDDRVLAEPAMLVALVREEGFDPERMQASIDELTLELQTHERGANASTGAAKEVYEKKANGVKRNIALFKAAQQVLSSDENLQQAFDEVDTGNKDAAVLRDAIQSFRTGSMDSLIRVAAPEITDSEERKRMEEILKKAGVGSGLAMILSLLGVNQIIEQFILQK